GAAEDAARADRRLDRALAATIIGAAAALELAEQATVASPDAAGAAQIARLAAEGANLVIAAGARERDRDVGGEFRRRGFEEVVARGIALVAEAGDALLRVGLFHQLPVVVVAARQAVELEADLALRVGGAGGAVGDERALL